jgi:hypothetical protein
MPRKIIDAPAEKVGQDGVFSVPSEGPARIVAPSIEVPEKPVDEEKLAMLKFMEDVLEIQIHSSTDKTADQVFEVFINNEREVFRRGEAKKVKRKFVEKLALTKVTNYENKEVRSEEGEKAYVYPSHTALRYPFSVLFDPHPRGGDWLRWALATR